MGNLPKRYLNIASGIEHQKSSNWCSNHAVSSLIESLFARVNGRIDTLSNSWGMMLSKKVDNRPDASGTPIDIIMDEICKYGMCTESLYPTWEDKDYHDNKFLETTSEMYEVASMYKPKKRVKIDVDDIDTIKQYIVNNSGCVAVVRVYNEHTFPHQGFVTKPERGTEPDGLHAIWICGYIENVPKTINGETYKDWFILQESYGSTRGYKGYLFVPYDAFINKHLWTGYYSNDQYIKEVHAFDIDKSKIKYPSYHNNNKIVFPMKEIILTVNSKDARVDGARKTLVYPPIIENGTTLVPFRFICEELEYSVTYHSDTKEITAYSRNKNQLITMKVGSRDILFQQGAIKKTVKSSVPVKVVEGNTLIPVRPFSELTGATVEYDSKTKEISIRV